MSVCAMAYDMSERMGETVINSQVKRAWSSTSARKQRTHPHVAPPVAVVHADRITDVLDEHVRDLRRAAGLIGAGALGQPHRGATSWRFAVQRNNPRGLKCLHAKVSMAAYLQELDKRKDVLDDSVATAVANLALVPRAVVAGKLQRKDNAQELGTRMI